MIMTNEWGECFFKILQPNMKELRPPYYQWRIGENVITPHDEDEYTHIACFNCFLGALNWSDAFRVCKFNSIRVCWISIPVSEIQKYCGRTIRSTKAIIYRVKTGEELRKEDSPLYRLFISNLASHPLIIDDITISLYNGFDWMLHVLFNHDSLNLEVILIVLHSDKNTNYNEDQIQSYYLFVEHFVQD